MADDKPERAILSSPKGTKCDFGYDDYKKQFHFRAFRAGDASVPDFYPSHATPPPTEDYRVRDGLALIPERFTDDFEIVLEKTPKGKLTVPSCLRDDVIAACKLWKAINNYKGLLPRLRPCPVALIETVAADGMRELTMVNAEKAFKKDIDRTKYELVRVNAITPAIYARLTPETADFLTSPALWYYARTQNYYV